MTKVRMTKPGAIPQTTVSAEVLDDPKVIKRWEAQGYKVVGRIEDDMHDAGNAVPNDIKEDSVDVPGNPDRPGPSVDELLEPLGEDVIQAVKDGGFDTIKKLKGATRKQLIDLPEIGRAKAKKIAELAVDA